MYEENFYSQPEAREGGGGSAEGPVYGRSETKYTIVHGSIKQVTLMKFRGLLGYHKPHVTDYIAIYAPAYMVL